MLPTPYTDFFVYERHGRIRLRFAAKGTNFENEFLEVKLEREIPAGNGRSLAETFMRSFPGVPPHPRILAARTEWKHCGRIAWVRGSEQQMRDDLSVVARVFGRKHGFEINQGTAFFYAMTGTPNDQPTFLTESFHCIYRGDFSSILDHLGEFTSTLHDLEAGLFARNCPMGCDGFTFGDRPHMHSSRKLFIPVIHDDRLTSEGDERPSTEQDEALYAEIKFASERTNQSRA
jgi:hypothetical protein